MLRREFIAAFGGIAAAGWPFATQAQQAMRRVAVLMASLGTDPEDQAT
jgi:hypothetical protein